jgi:hypothetical protein
MPFRKTILVVSILALALLAGCKKKKPNVPPPQAQAPTVTAPAPQPEPVTPPQEPPPSTEPVKPEPTPPSTTATKPKPKPRRPRTPAPEESKPATATQPTLQANAKPPAGQLPKPPITRVPSIQPAPNTVQIVPGLPHDEALHQRLTTDQLLRSTEQNLASLRRTLSSDEREVVQQIKLYLQQSRSATTDGDLVRARTLALKAHLLSDELVKP